MKSKIKNKVKNSFIILISILMLIQMVGSVFAEDVTDTEKVADTQDTTHTDNIGNLEEQIQTYVNENNPGNAAVAVAVTNLDQTLYQDTFGYINKEKKIKADDQTVFEWGSISKVLTWISAMQLYEQGKLHLDEDIRVYLPANYLKKLKYDKPVTMLDLMNHTAGWQDSITNVYTKHATEVLPLQEYVAKYEPEQLYEPGTTVAYSNWGTTLAGLIVERVSEENYCDYVKNHIFIPLGMQKTSIDPLRNDNGFVKKAIENNTGYDTNGKELPGRFYAPDYPAAGAAGVAGDLEILMQALLGSEKHQLFQKKETLQTMLHCTNTLGDSDIPESAHGLWYDFYTTPSLGHYGNTVQFSAHMSLSPETGKGVLVMTNQAQEMKLNHGIGEFVFGDGNFQEDTADRNETYQFHTYYTGARTIEKGFCRFYHLMQIYKVKYVEDDTLLLSALGMNIHCKKVSDKLYRCDTGYTEGYYFYLSVDENGVVQSISTSTFDIIPYSTIKVVFDILTTVLVVLALFVALITLILCVIKMLKKNKGYGIPCVMSIFSLGYYVLVILETLILITTAGTRTDVIPHIVGYVIYLFIGFSNLIWFVLKQKKNAVTIMTVFSSVSIMIYILYLQMFLL